MRGNERIDVPNPRGVNEVKAGDITVSLGCGGAGVGPPQERDPKVVRLDVKNEIVSLEAAREVYKVALNADTLEIEQEETRKLRRKE